MTQLNSRTKTFDRGTVRYDGQGRQRRTDSATTRQKKGRARSAGGDVQPVDLAVNPLHNNPLQHIVNSGLSAKEAWGGPPMTNRTDAREILRNYQEAALGRPARQRGTPR